MASSTLPFSQLAEQCYEAGLTPANGAKIAAELSRSFGVHDDEVAIFKVEQTHLRFVYPAKLSSAGMIPLNHAHSIAARTATAKRGEVVNNVAQMRHASVFESVPVDSTSRGGHSEKSAMVIQKMMSVPVLGPAGVVGVIQISRKGITQKSAGSDFQPADLHRLAAVANVLARCFK